MAILFGNKPLDATRGAMIPQIVRYSIPLIISVLIQKLFGAVDLAVLGQMASTEAVASVGATVSIVDLIVNSFFGIAGGARILLAYQLGQSHDERLRRTVGTCLSLAVLLGVGVAVLGFVFSPILLTLTNCPAACIDGATSYLRIYILAAPAVLLYHFGAAVLMTSGDTQRPLYYMIACSGLNVVLNVILCLILPDKVVAVALATAASQLLGAFLVMLRLFRMEGVLRVSWRQLRLHGEPVLKILRFGLPMALTGSLFPLAGLQIQTAVNSFGPAAIAGDSAACVLGGVVGAFGDSFQSAMGTFLGQNLGAGNRERVRASILHCTWLSAASSFVIGMILLVTGRFWLGLILGGDEAAIEYAMVRVFWLVSLYFIFEFAYALSIAVQSFGYPTVSSMINLAWILGFRVLWMTFLYPLYPSYLCLILCFFVSWFGMLFCNGISLSVVWRRYRKGKMAKM